MTFIFITVLLDMLAFGIIAPVFQPLVLGFTHGNYAAASWTVGIFATLFAIVQFFASPLLGVLSDRFGRRPIVLLSNLGTSLDYAILALAPNLAWLFVGRILSGLTTASMTVASAYVADVTPEDKRAGAYGMISACFGIGFVVGPAIGGLLGAHDPRLPFWAAGGLSFVNFLYGLFVLPESLDREHRNPFTWKRANPLGSIALLRRHPELTGLGAVNLISFIASQALPQVYVLYVLYAYHWAMHTVGISLAVVGIMTILVSAFVIQPAVKKLGERRAVVVGFAFGAIGFVLYAGNEVLFWIGICVNMLWMIAGSATQAMMTRRVGKQEQGELQGAVTMLRSVSMMIGPLFFNGIFAYSTDRTHGWTNPNLAWYAGAVLLAGSALLATRVTTATDDASEDVDRLTPLENAIAAETPLAE